MNYHLLTNILSAEVLSINQISATQTSRRCEWSAKKMPVEMHNWAKRLAGFRWLLWKRRKLHQKGLQHLTTPHLTLDVSSISDAIRSDMFLQRSLWLIKLQVPCVSIGSASIRTQPKSKLVWRHLRQRFPRRPLVILKPSSKKKSGRTNCKRKQIPAKRNCVRLANFTCCRRSELNINLNSWNAPLTNLHRFLSCRDKNNLVSCTFKVQQTVPSKFFLSTDPSWVGRSNETSSNQSPGTLNQKKGKEGALLQHQGANYKMIVKSEPPQRRVRVQLFCHFHCDKHVFIQNAHFFISNL